MPSSSKPATALSSTQTSKSAMPTNNTLASKHSMLHIKSLFSYFVLTLLLALTTHAHALTAKVDRMTLPENESLMLELSGAFSAFNLNIDLEPLEQDFRILDTHRNSSVQWINGDFTSQTTLTVTLEPRRQGTLTIPSLSIEDASTDPIAITVTPANTLKNDIANSPIAVEVTLDNDTSWVNAQNILTVTIYDAVKVYNPELLGISELEDLDIRIEKLGKNKHYRAKRNNQQYEVTELRYLFYPNTPGKVDFGGIIYQGQIATPNSRYGKRVRVSADTATLNVNPIPDNYPSKHWIPAKNLVISDDLDRNITINTGDTLNRNIVISVEGQESAVIPSLLAPDTQLINLYQDSPELNDQKTERGITGVRIDSQAIITKQPGTVELPEIRIPWFNIDTAQVEIATLPSRTLTINGPTQTQSSQPLQGADNGKNQHLPADALSNQTSTPEGSTTETSPTENSPSENSVLIQDTALPAWALWLIALLVLLVMILAIAVVCLFMHRSPSQAGNSSTEASNSGHNSLDFHQLSTCSYAQFSLQLNRSLKQNQLELNQLDPSVLSLIEKFRQSEYAAHKDQSVAQGFSQAERKQLKSALEHYFNHQLHRQDDQVKLYPS